MTRMLFALAVAVAYIAGRYTAPEAAPAKPVVTVKTEKQVETIRIDCPEHIVDTEDERYEDEDPDAIEAEDTEAVRMLEVESKRIAELEASLGMKGAVRGQIKDAETEERLAGVTVVASNGTGAQTAITDENGAYDIVGLTEGRYTVTLYYLDVTIEHSDVMVAAQKVTPLYGKIVQSPPVIEPYGHGITIDTDYVKNIPTGRTFEGVLGAADEGVTTEYESFDNTGVIEDDGTTVDGEWIPNLPAEGMSLGVSFSGANAAHDAYDD